MLPEALEEGLGGGPLGDDLRIADAQRDAKDRSGRGMKKDGRGVPADWVGVIEIGVLLVQTQHLLQRARRVQGFLLALGQLVV